ncbi:unnamed protein product (macronuclear) [Paramecium tetraurelia]|uniref:Thioredoxin domain-containing protein n=1 Tax=Paramecium tetraurelia TaxID=5888 RepID=A0BLV4_PARTE|nr:uncharacterized protein GSPATT00030155001 [Paramecium tetraurelia]CAK59521.1 unnamed protein product [Paramecium tetraurelia]|eukprot:XP_001426919.1 hypothetical protein (macronuclear) [Paramecium tetraurelia strain d4-2]
MIIVLLILLFDVNADWYHSTLAFTLAANNYQQHLGKQKHVNFFTPWCIYCQHMAGEFNQVFEHYKATRPDILIAKMNCEEQQNRHICHHFGVHSFPTIFYFPPGQDKPTSQFENHRRFEFFVQWIDSLAESGKQKMEKMLREQEQQEQRLKEMMELEKQKEIEFEEQEIKKEEEIKISQFIQLQITEANTFNGTIKGVEKEIQTLQQKTAELNIKLGQMRKMTRVNVNHALVFGIIGLFIGVAMTSCVCLFQKTNHVYAEKGV